MVWPQIPFRFERTKLLRIREPDKRTPLKIFCNFADGQFTKISQQMTIIFFTATGNSLSVAKAIGGRLMSVGHILRTRPAEISDPEGIGIVTPVYNGNLPEPVELLVRRIGSGELRVDAPYRFAVMTYGEIAGCAVNIFARLAFSCRLQLHYLRSIKMVDNNFTVVNVGRQICNQLRKHIPEHVDEIVADISSRRIMLEQTGIVGLIAGPFMGLWRVKDPGRRFSFEREKCNGCGVCADVCPKRNIRFTDRRPVWGDDCLLCTACYHNCPQGAVRFYGERSTIQYRNPAVSLREICEANGGK